MSWQITLKDIEETIKLLNKPTTDLIYIPQELYNWLHRKSRTWQEYKEKKPLLKILKENGK